MVGRAAGRGADTIRRVRRSGNGDRPPPARVTLSHHRIGAGEPLVLVHGLGSHKEMWDPVLGRLAAEREVVAVDLPGFGRSAPFPPGRAPTVTALAGAVAALAGELGLGVPHVAGNSLGGGIALELGRTGRARSVTCLSPIGFWSVRELAWARASLRATHALARALAPVAPIVLRPRAGRIGFGQLLGRPWRMPPGPAAHALRDLAAAPAFHATLDAALAARDPGGRLPVPVTIAWGDRDLLLLPRQGRRAARRLPGARLIALRGCGHLPTWDDPDLVADVLLAGSGGGEPGAASREAASGG